MNRLERGLIVFGLILGFSGIGKYVLEKYISGSQNTEIPIYLLANSFVFLGATSTYLMLKNRKKYNIGKKYEEISQHISKNISKKDYDKL